MELFNHLKEQLSNKTKISSNYIGRNIDIPKFFFTQIRKSKLHLSIYLDFGKGFCPEANETI
jgi:hypothetical protein